MTIPRKLLQMTYIFYILFLSLLPLYMPNYYLLGRPAGQGARQIRSYLRIKILSYPEES